MHPGSTPHNVSSVLSFQQATSTNLQLASSTQRYPLHGGISKDGKVCWLYSGSILEVVSCNTRNCLAAWNFGNFSHDAETIIQCVSEFWTGDSLKLLVGLKTNSTSSKGLLCVLHIGLSKVVKAIEIPFPVTSVECVTSLLGNDFLVWSFSEQLSCFYGIVAAGTEGGHVYLIDMCLDTYDLSDETFPNSLYFITPETDAVQARHEALSQRQVLSMELGIEAFSVDDLFNYQGNDEDVVKQFNTDDISVTCLKYMTRNGLLAVGFSFGCFQLWRLALPFLEYSSHIDDSGDVPITHIAYQEPENDPKFFTYIWVARGLQAFTSDNGYVANISLYQLTFNKRMWQANEEYFYEEMTSIGIRLEHDLSCDPLMPSKTFSSNVISCFTLEDPNFVPSRIFDDSHEEVCSSPDLSLSVFVWKAIDGSKNGAISYHLSIFDMNRWYHLQMPSTLRTIRSSGVCPFMAFCSLDEVVDSTVDDELLNIYINPSTVRKFICDPLVAQEQFFYPASLQFDVLCLMENGLLSAKYLGMQREVLNTIQKLGPSCLIEPTEIYKMCLLVGLVHRSQESAPQSFSIVGFQREALLSLCLEYHMVNVILKCIDEWADGEFTAQKCTLKYLLDWSWNKVVQIKESIDNNTKHFFDWSGLPIDDTCIQGLHRCLQKFTYLAQIFHKFTASSVPTTENGIEELKQKLDALQLLSHHLKAVIWFVEAGLLPENDELANDTPGLYKYPRLNLFEEFSKRRNEIKQLNSDLKPNELLMIDGLIANMAPSVYDVWKQDGGNELYPPPSISALLYIYLLEDVSLITKHCVVGYFFLDLASLGEEDNSKLAAKVTAFSQIFSVPTETMNLITGFWFLDHKDFEVAFYSLVKSSVFGQWQHRQVIKSLLYQEEYKLALQYLAVKKPPLSSPEEIKLKLTTFLSNGMTAQAVEFYRSCCNQTNAEDLITHIFLGCQQRKILSHLVKLPLTEAEEKWLEKYLMTSPESDSKEALVVYYLQRARYVDAVKLNEKLKSKDMSSMSEREKNMTSTRNIIVKNCLKLLPEIQLQYLHESNLIPKKRINRVTRPKPLSTIVTKSIGPKVISQSNLILAIMEKMDEVERLNNSLNDSRSFDEESLKDIAAPFISAPFTPQKTALPNFSRFTSEKSLMKDTTSSSRSLSNRKSILLSQEYTLAQDEHFGYLEQPARRKPKYVSAEALSVLQTPVIQRKSTLQSKMTSPRPTPQSILKVRQMSARSPSFNMSMSMDKDSSGLRNSGRSSRSSTNNSFSVTPTATSVKRTSKSLRFAEPASRNLSPNSSNGSYTSMPALLSKTAPRTEISAADRHQMMDNILALLDNDNVEDGQEVAEMDTDGVEEEEEAEEEEEEDTGSFIEEEDDYEEEHRRKMHVDDDDDDDARKRAAEKVVAAEVARVLAEVRKVKKQEREEDDDDEEEEEEDGEMQVDDSDSSDDLIGRQWQQAASSRQEFGFAAELSSRYPAFGNEVMSRMEGQTSSLASKQSTEQVDNDQVSYTTDSDDVLDRSGIRTHTLRVDSDIVFAFQDSVEERPHDAVSHTSKRLHIEVDTDSDDDDDVAMECVEPDTDVREAVRDGETPPIQRESLPTTTFDVTTAIPTLPATTPTFTTTTTTTTMTTTPPPTPPTTTVTSSADNDAAAAGCYQVDDDMDEYHHEDSMANVLLKHASHLLASSTPHTTKVISPAAPPPIVDLTDDQDEEVDYSYDFTEGRQQANRVEGDHFFEPEESDDILEICPLSGPQQQPTLTSSYHHPMPKMEETPAEQILIDDDDEEEEEEVEEEEEEAEVLEEDSEVEAGFVKVEHVEEKEVEEEEERDDVLKVSSVEEEEEGEGEQEEEEDCVRVEETEMGKLLAVEEEEGEDAVSEAEYVTMETAARTDTVSQIVVGHLQPEHRPFDNEDQNDNINEENIPEQTATDVISMTPAAPSLDSENEDAEMRVSYIDEQQLTNKEEDGDDVVVDDLVTSASSSENLTSFSLSDTSCMSASTRQEITAEAETMQVSGVAEEVTNVTQEVGVAMTTRLQPEMEVAPAMPAPTPMMESTSHDLSPVNETLPQPAANETRSEFPATKTLSKRRASLSRKNKMTEHGKFSVREETSQMEVESKEDKGDAGVGEKVGDEEDVTASQSTPHIEFTHTLRKRTSKTPAVVAESVTKGPESVKEEMKSQSNVEADRSSSPLPMRVLRSSTLSRKAKLETPPPTPTHEIFPSAPQKSFIAQPSARRKTFIEESPTIVNIRSKTQNVMEVSLQGRPGQRSTSEIPTDPESSVKVESEATPLTPPSRRRKSLDKGRKTRSSQRISKQKAVSESFIESSLPVLAEDSPTISIELEPMTTSESMGSQQKPQKKSTKNQSFVTPAATPRTRLQKTSHKKNADDNNTIIKETESVSKSPQKDKLYSASVLIPMISDILPLATELQTPIRVRSTRRKAYLVNPVDSPINFLTPGPCKPASQKSDTDKTKTTRKPSPGRTPNQQPFHGMVLRPKAAPVKKRKL